MKIGRSHAAQFSRKDNFRDVAATLAMRKAIQVADHRVVMLINAWRGDVMARTSVLRLNDRGI